ncbi:NAD(P)-binding domain-containing protein [Bacillus sp. SD088]|nr:NAD(P)-binding domain-containing protein [Bacillus sp. SD088]
MYDVIIVGAGPSGIGVAALLQQMKASYLVLEKDEVGASLLRWPKEMKFITPSFPAQGFGQTDLNAVVPKTSPAYICQLRPNKIECGNYCSSPLFGLTRER